MTSKVCFDEICRDALNCKEYIEWDLELELPTPGRAYQSTITCVSCQLVGQSYNIEEYPIHCPHKEILQKYEVERKIAMQKFEYNLEQTKIWRRLNAV